MGKVQKRVLSGLILICAVLILGACTPEPDPTVPTDTIVITNIPKKIFRTHKDATDSDKKDTFKVYLQLSAGMTADSVSSAMGDVKVTEGTPDGDWITVSIPLYSPVEGAPYKPNMDAPYSGTNWSNVAVVISPEKVKDIFDIDIKVGLAGPSTSSTVTIDWRRLYSKKTMVWYSGDDIAIDNYKRLYGKESATDGVIVNDNDIKDDTGTGKPQRVGKNDPPAKIGDLTDKNDYQIY